MGAASAASEQAVAVVMKWRRVVWFGVSGMDIWVPYGVGSGGARRIAGEESLTRLQRLVRGAARAVVDVELLEHGKSRSFSKTENPWRESNWQ